MAQYASVVRARGWWIEGINKDTKDSDRDPLLRAFEADKSPATILVSCRTLSEGIDLKNANCMLPWDPTASIIDNIQRIGRVVRLYKTAAGAIAKDQPPSTILIPVFLEEAEYAACDGNREAIHKLLEKQIGEGEKGNFRPIVSVCTALKSELAQEDSDLFNQLLNYPYTPKVRVDKDLVACVAKQLKRPEEDILEEVADSLVGQLDEEVIDSIRVGEWDSEETGAVVTALAESQGIKLIIRDNEKEEVVGTGTKEIIIERKGEGVYTASRKKKSSDAARQRVAHRLRTSFSDGCRVLLGLEGADLNATEGLVLARLTAEVQYDEDWEKRRLEWVAMYEKLGRSPSHHLTDDQEKRAGQWQQQQRHFYKNKISCLTAERIEALQLTKGWEWEKEDTWEASRLHWIAQYKIFKKAPSHSSENSNEIIAARWQSRQRRGYKMELSWMTSQRIKALDDTEGWEWEEDTWEPNRLHWLSQYLRFKKTPSPTSTDADERQAGLWQTNVRQYYRRGLSWMTPERIKSLEDMEGWEWEPEESWEPNRLHWLSQYKILKKTPTKHSKNADEKQAGKWASNQCTGYREKASWMTPERITLLNNTEGWKWEKRKDTWEIRRKEWLAWFQKFKKNPSEDSKNIQEKRAGQWQADQRKRFKQRKLTPERVEALNKMTEWTWEGRRVSSITPIPPAPTNEVVYPAEVVPQKKKPVPERKRSVPTEIVSTKETAPRTLSILEELHKAYKTRNADTYFSLIQANPSKFEEYHVVADAYDARDPPERKPQNRIAEMLKKNNRATYRAVDLGCGRNTLRRDERVSKMSWDSVDVVAADSTVTVADMGHLPFEDETYDIAILNRSLWARNHEEVLREVYRILKEGGRAILCESFQRWQDAGKNTLLEALKTVGFTILSEVGTTTDSAVEDVFQYIEVRRDVI
jgi:hypothetical protein